MLIVQRNTNAPTLNPVTPDVGEVGSVITAPPLPDTCVQYPVPIVGVFPASEAVVPHTLWSVPAAAIVPAAEIVIVTVSRVIVHAFLVIAHSNKYVPFVIPVTVLVFRVALVIIASPPSIFVHCPVPGAGAFAAKVTEVVPDGKHWSAPANEAIGPAVALVVTITLSDDEPQLLEIIQVNVYVVLGAIPFTVALGEFAFENVIPADGDAVHVPISFKSGALPVNVYGAELQMFISDPAAEAVGVGLATYTSTSS